MELELEVEIIDGGGNGNDFIVLDEKWVVSKGY